MAWWFSPKTRLFFLVIVLVTIAVVFLVDMIGLYLPGTARVLIVVIGIILYFVLITMIDRLKRRAWLTP